MNSVEASVLLDPEEVGALVARMAGAITGSGADRSDLVLIGIQTGGVHLARQLSDLLQGPGGVTIPVGRLDISMHRDDLARNFAPPVHPTDIPFDVTDKTVVLVDDVIFTGRTARAALDALGDLGRPRRILLAVLVDRGHRELPIKADVVGRTISTRIDDRVRVEVDGAGRTKVILEKAPPR